MITLAGMAEATEARANIRAKVRLLYDIEKLYWAADKRR
jgi:hypothetical protein